MKKFILIFFIGILFFSQNIKIFALTEAEQIAEWQRVVAEMEKENINEKWIYFFDAIAQKIVKFFNYNDEFESTSTPKITEDWNTAIYSIWDWVFFKNFLNLNFSNNENLWIWNFWEIEIDENSVKLFKTEINWETLILSWKDEEKFDWYLIQIKDNIDWFLNWESKNLFYLLKKNFDEWIWWEEWKKNKIKNLNIEKNFSEIKKNFLNWETNFLIEKKFSKPELKIFLNENFFYAKIFWITSWNNSLNTSRNWKISTASAQKIIYWNKDNLKPDKNFTKIEKLNFPILVENYLKISDLFYLEKENWDIFSWDFDWDGIFENNWEKIFLPIQQELWSFFVNLQITKKTWEKFIRKIQLNFFSPKIFLDRDENWKIFWHIEPRINNFPVFYTYENDEINKKYWSEKIFTGKYWNKNWEFSFLKKSEKNYEIEWRKIYLENKEILWKIFLKTWNVELKFSDKYWSFLVISENTESWKKVIALIYLNWKIKIYDKNYQIVKWEKSWNNWKDFYLKKSENKLKKSGFYFNFWVNLK